LTPIPTAQQPSTEHSDAQDPIGEAKSTDRRQHERLKSAFLEVSNWVLDADIRAFFD
jgi:hypothetical protein